VSEFKWRRKKLSNFIFTAEMGGLNARRRQSKKAWQKSAKGRAGAPNAAKPAGKICNQSKKAWQKSAKGRAGAPNAAKPAGKTMGSPIKHASKRPKFDSNTVRFGWVGV
jgi:hypothetical protein